MEAISTIKRPLQHLQEKKRPRIAAMLMCQEVIDRSVGRPNHSLMNVFSTVTFPSFPAVQKRLCVYAEVENLSGAREIHFNIEVGESSYRCIVSPIKAQSTGLQAYIAWFKEIEFPTAGEYTVSARDSKGTLLAERVLYVGK